MGYSTSYPQAQEYREALLDAVVELDDDAMEAYLDVRSCTPPKTMVHRDVPALGGCPAQPSEWCPPKAHSLLTTLSVCAG